MSLFCKYGTRLIHQVLVDRPFADVQDTLSTHACRTCDAQLEAISAFAHHRFMAWKSSANGRRVSVTVLRSIVPMSPPLVHSITSGIMQGRSQPPKAHCICSMSSSPRLDLICDDADKNAGLNVAVLQHTGMPSSALCVTFVDV